MTNAMTLQLAGSVSLQAVSERRRDECLRARLQSETDPDDADDANDANARRYAREWATGDARVNAACV